MWLSDRSWGTIFGRFLAEFMGRHGGIDGAD
jgi:hypothetical protein